MSEKINETEVKNVGTELDPEERLDCIFTFNDMKIVKLKIWKIHMYSSGFQEL